MLGRVVAQSQPRERSQTSSAFTGYTTPSSPLYRATTTTYNALDRPLVVTPTDGTTTVSSYGVNGDGPWTKVIDANGHQLIH